MTKKQPSFELSISGRGDGTIEAAYISFGTGKVAITKEIATDVLLADFDARGNLLGLELLAPVRVSRLLRQVVPRVRKPLKAFLLSSAPRDWVQG